jgi:hypothetical protein
MYYEVHGSGDHVVLLHGSFMTITNNWAGWIGELSKTRKVITIEMQGHGRTADIQRDFSYENLTDDVVALLDFLEIPSADLNGYIMGGGAIFPETELERLSPRSLCPGCTDALIQVTKLFGWPSREGYCKKLRRNLVG